MITEFQLAGNSKAVANTSIGQITLNPIKVNVTTSLWGLKGLQGGLTIIKSVDVMGGTTEAITLSIDTGIYNPSSLELATGDLTLQLFRQGSGLGTVLLPNLSLGIGNNTITAIGLFTPNDSPLGQQTLNEFVGGKDVNLNIAGYDQSTNVPSLLQAFETLNISVVLPGLNMSLLSSAALEGTYVAIFASLLLDSRTFSAAHYRNHEQYDRGDGQSYESVHIYPRYHSGHVQRDIPRHPSGHYFHCHQFFGCWKNDHHVAPFGLEPQFRPSCSIQPYACISC